MKRLRLLQLSGAKKLRCLVARPLRALAPFRSWTPQRLVIAPQDARTADPTVAHDIYSGYFALAGKIVNVHDRSPFEVESPSEAWAEALAGFGWLRHLRAADTALARANARVLVDDWITTHGAPDSTRAWRPDPTTRRLLSWLAQAPLILQGADEGFHRRFLKALGRHAGRLNQYLLEGLDERARLVALVALCEFSLCAAGAESLRRRMIPLLEEELARQILADGGHISRNPQALVDLLLDFLPLRQIFATRGMEPPRQLLNAVDRIGPMLRLFRHGDGELALFNGMGATKLDDVATILAYDDVRAKPILNAVASGYQRLEAGDCVVVTDAGRPPPYEFSGRAHAGALSFELSSGAQRLVVNCGAPATGRPDLREAARLTAAHSTLILDERSSCRFSKSGAAPARILSGPTIVETRRFEDQVAVGLECTHNGYEKKLNFIHRRRLKLFKAAARLEGEDALSEGASGAKRSDLDWAVRFHLHPAAGPIVQNNESSIEVGLPDGQRWVFCCEDAPATIEESIFFASPHGAQSTRQIVLRSRLSQRARISWSFGRIEPGAEI